MNKRNYSQWTLSFAALGGLIGISLGQIGDFSWGAILGGLTAVVLSFIVNVIYVKNKSDNTPEFDERTRQKMKTFYFYASHTFLAIIIIVLAILISIGVTSISTSTVMLVLFGYFVISGMIAFVISRV
ncbi:hypothetical protein [Oceanobacillus manasiensis]|uniref:hypothetical protein n=1 Tax=Oceanobacillus manasiensis TaxID=586413 RepID=UPI0005AA7140|nr:hypothetical protein [Oceanobacillus manasiensis]